MSTSLVAITNDLQGFSQSSWVITAYLLTYFGQETSSATGSELTNCGRLAHHLGKTQRHIGTEDYNSYFNSYLYCLLSSLRSSSDNGTTVSISATSGIFHIAGDNITTIESFFEPFRELGAPDSIHLS